MLDLIIRGGDVVTPQGVAKCDVAVKGETIAAVAAPGTLADADAARVIDATGKIVMPGGIDPHVHMAHPFMTPDGKTLYTQGPDRVGMAALWGGTTTLIDFAYATADRSVQKGIEARDEQFAPKSCCDWAYHLMLGSEPPHTQMGELAEAIQAGYPTIKIFTTNIWPHRTGRMVDFGDIWEVFKVLAKEGGLGVIHAEDNDIVMHMYAKLIREGRVGFENLAEVHNTLSEDLSFRRVLRLAESVPGTALYMMHVSAATGVAAISEARAKGLPIYGESLHQYMLHTAEDYKLPNGQIYHTYPSLKSARGPEGAVGRHAQRRHQLRRHRRAVLHAAREDAWAGASTTPPAATRASSRGSASCTRRWWCGAAIRCPATSISSRPTRRRSWASIRARARLRPAATPTSPSSIPPGAARCAPTTCTRPTTRRGRATTSSPGRS